MTDVATEPPSLGILEIARRLVRSIVADPEPRLARCGYDEQHDCIWARLDRDGSSTSGGLLRFARRDFDHALALGTIPAGTPWPGDDTGGAS